MNNVHFSSKSDEWETPPEFFEQIEQEFGPFNLDVCATSKNSKCAQFIPRKTDGLKVPWDKKNWCNPPYSDLAKWIEKARTEQKHGNLTVMLMPARTDTKAFHQYIYKKRGVQIRFIKGRLKFNGSKHSAPFPSMIVIFKPRI